MKKKIPAFFTAAMMLISSSPFTENCEAVVHEKTVNLGEGQYEVIKWDPSYDYIDIFYDERADDFLEIKNIKTSSGEYYTYIRATDIVDGVVYITAITVDGHSIIIHVCSNAGNNAGSPPPQTSDTETGVATTTVVSPYDPPATTQAPATSATMPTSAAPEDTTSSNNTSNGSVTTTANTITVTTTTAPGDPNESPLATTSYTSLSDGGGSSSPAPNEPSPWIIANDYGDVNSDGYIDMRDLTDLSLALLKEKKLSEAEYLAADVNFDYKVNLADLAVFMQYLSKARDGIVLGPQYTIVYR